MKKYKTGIVIGKFMPFHKGHEALINYANNNVEKLTVIVCNTDSYIIPSDLRAQWIKNLFNNIDVRILNHSERLDSDSPSVSKEWAELTSKFLKFKPDAVFSSEEYGKPYANHMGSKHILYDIDRTIHPISGTIVRTNPYDNWNMINNDVKRYYQKKITILGAESTGTTTLAKNLAKHYKKYWVPEYGRTYYEGKMFSEHAEEWSSDEFDFIAKQQNKLEDYFSYKGSKLLICDTDSFTTSVWHLRYLNYKSETLPSIYKDRKYDLYILTDIDIPFEQDGTRDGENIREWMHNRFIKELKTHHKNYIIVSGSLDQRMEKSIEYIDDLFKSN